MRKIIAVILTVFLFITSGTMTAFAAESNGKTPSGIDYSKLKEQIEDYIDVRKETTSSVSVTVFNERSDIATVIYGDANTRDGIQADENTVYEWGSVSKMLVWTSVMQLWEQGKIDLEADIRNYLPDDFLSNLSYDKPVTMLNLMNHTAGFQETVWDVEVTDKNDLVSLKDALLDTAPAQIYEPGTIVSYSNWGAALAAYIVECVSGLDYADYVHQNIFEPLGMEQTFIRPDGSDNEWAEGQRQKTNAYYNVQGAYEDYGECRRYILIYPAGSATGTMSDLVRFAKAFLSDSADCSLFAEPNTLSEMLSPTLYFDGTDTPRICYGLFSQEYSIPLIGHAGNTTGFTANLVLDLASKTGIVVMTNEVSETAYCYGLISLIFGDCKAEDGFTYDDLSGIYCNSRANYRKSFTKFYSMISGLLPVTGGETEGSYQAVAGEITQISKDACIMDDGNGFKTYLSIKRDESGNVIALQHMVGMDFQKANPVGFVLQIVFFLAFVMLSGWMVVMSVVHGVTLYKFRQTSLFKKKLYQLLSELFMVFMSIMIYWLIVPPTLLSSSLVKEQVVWKCILIIIFTVAETVILLLGWFDTKDKDSVIPSMCQSRGKWIRNRIGFAITRISGVILIASVLYWHFYQFWGC